jgi:hypothetical protein
MKQFKFIWIPISFSLIWLACSDTEQPPNPFDGQVVSQDTVGLVLTNPEPTSFAGIYKNILKPTCANSGCHDGTFEPDYRTMGSAYNTLVYQSPIKNDGNYTYRVEPYNAQGSVLMARLKNLITPSMPIQVEPDSDWPQKKDEYISNIQTWINGGAPDITGNIRQINHPAPELLGAGAAINNAWMIRDADIGPLLMPGGTNNVRFYFAFRHDELLPTDLTYNRIAFSENANAFDGAQQMQLQILATPRLERGFYGGVVEYTHYIDLDPAAGFSAQQEQWYFRVYVQDTQNPVTEIPTNNGIYYIKSYMSFRWIP